MKELREKLYKAYTEFKEKWGFLNSNRNKRVILTDPDGFRILSSLEVKLSDKEFRESDVLTKDILEQEKYTTSDPIEALGWCLGTYGRVDLSIIGEILDSEEDEIIRELGELIYWSPIDNEWQEASKWLSGNVYVKMIKTQEILAELVKE